MANTRLVFLGCGVFGVRPFRLKLALAKSLRMERRDTSAKLGFGSFIRINSAFRKATKRVPTLR